MTAGVGVGCREDCEHSSHRKEKLPCEDAFGEWVTKSDGPDF